MDPVFVPGSETIVYTVLEQPTLLALMRLDLATGQSERLHPAALASEFEPAFSADGRYCAFVQSRGNLNLKLVIRDTRENKDAEYDAGGGFAGMHCPAFTADGGRAFFSIPAANGQQIASCNLAGKDRQTITQTTGISNWPRFSPNGRQLAFGSSRDGDFEIYAMRPDGGDVHRLTESPGRDVRPTWSPDAQRLAFTSVRDGNPEIYVMAADGSNPRNATQHADSDDYAAWHPDGKRLVTVSQRQGRYDLYLFDVPE